MARTKAIVKKTVAIKKEKSTGVPQVTSSTPNGVQKRPRKPVRWKPGTVALREVRRLQRSTQRLIPKASIYRLINEIVRDQALDMNLNVTQITPHAREALWTECEDYVQELFKATQTISVLRGGVTITPKDMQHVVREAAINSSVIRNIA